MIGCRLDNQMNFGNPPLIPASANLICVNGSNEEIDFNRAADELLFSDPGAFLDALLDNFNITDWTIEKDWLSRNIQAREEWVNTTLMELDRETSHVEF